MARTEVVILVGIQASGKTTFYQQRLFETHVRLSLDMLRTRHRLAILFDACLRAQQDVVIDNTNPTRAERAPYIAAAKAARARVVGYYFDTDVRDAITRNRLREGKRAIPVPGIYGTRKRLEAPTLDEGFDELYRVRIVASGSFRVEKIDATI